RMQQSADSLEASGKSDFMNEWARIGPKQRPNRVSRFPAADIGNLGSASGVRRSDSSLFTDWGPTVAVNSPQRPTCGCARLSLSDGRPRRSQVAGTAPGRIEFCGQAAI